MVKNLGNDCATDSQGWRKDCMEVETFYFQYIVPRSSKNDNEEHRSIKLNCTLIEIHLFGDYIIPGFQFKTLTYIAHLVGELNHR